MSASSVLHVTVFPVPKLTTQPAPQYSITLFLPTIIQSMGYSDTRAQLLSVPPYAVACISTITIAYFADRSRQRGIFNVTMSLFAATGFAILISASNNHAKYFATFLVTMGLYPCISNTLSWVCNNTQGVYKRGVTLGIVVGWSQLNGIISSNVFPSKDKPRFLVGHSVSLAYVMVFLFGGSLLNMYLLRRENLKRLSNPDNLNGQNWADGKTAEEVMMMGDERYVKPMRFWMSCHADVQIGRISCISCDSRWAGVSGDMRVALQRVSRRRIGRPFHFPESNHCSHSLPSNVIVRNV